MIYIIKYTEQTEGKEPEVYTFEIDDTIFFDQQPQNFRSLFDRKQMAGMAEFDNCVANLTSTGRILIVEKEVNDEI